MWVDDFLRDIQYAVRRLWRDRVFAFTAFVTLGLGIAATVAMFMVVDAVLLRPVPFRASDRLVGVVEHHPQRGIMAVTPANLRDIQQQTTAFATLGAVEGDRANLHVGNASQSVDIGAWDATYLRCLTLRRRSAEPWRPAISSRAPTPLHS